MATRSRGAYAASMLTLAVFLAPALLAPGRLEIANLAGVALAVWLAIDAWRFHRRDDVPELLPHRVGPAAPGALGAAALIFTVAILHEWTQWGGAPSDRLRLVIGVCQRLWDFPGSPVALYAAEAPGLPEMTARARQGVLLTLSMAALCGAVFGGLTLLGGVRDRVMARRQALILKGETPTTAEKSLAARGARGLKPVRDRVAEADRRPVSARLAVRALALLVAAAVLPYAPFMLRISMGIEDPRVRRIFDSALFDLPFFTIWAQGLWASLIAGAIIFACAYLRLAVALRVR